MFYIPSVSKIRNSIKEEYHFYNVLSHTIGTELAYMNIRVPRVYNSTESIDKTNRVDLSHPSVQRFIKEMFDRGLILEGIEAYLQKNGIIVLTNFSKVYYRSISKDDTEKDTKTHWEPGEKCGVSDMAK
jgi:hypothetical protein